MSDLSWMFDPGEQPTDQAFAIWAEYCKPVSMDEIAGMSGRDFEELLVRLFLRMGYRKPEVYPAKDDGGDIVCLSPEGVRIVIQAKRAGNNVGVGAVQELLGGMVSYGCCQGVVVTNSTFTRPAKSLARKVSRLSLLDLPCSAVLRGKQWLETQLNECFPSETPPLIEEEYNIAEVRLWWYGRAGRTRRTRFNSKGCSCCSNIAFQAARLIVNA